MNSSSSVCSQLILGIEISINISLRLLFYLYGFSSKLADHFISKWNWGVAHLRLSRAIQTSCITNVFCVCLNY